MQQIYEYLVNKPSLHRAFIDFVLSGHFTLGGGAIGCPRRYDP